MNKKNPFDQENLRLFIESDENSYYDIIPSKLANQISEKAELFLNNKSEKKFIKNFAILSPNKGFGLSLLSKIVARKLEQKPNYFFIQIKNNNLQDFSHFQTEFKEHPNFCPLCIAGNHKIALIIKKLIEENHFSLSDSKENTIKFIEKNKSFSFISKKGEILSLGNWVLQNQTYLTSLINQRKLYDDDNLSFTSLFLDITLEKIKKTRDEGLCKCICSSFITESDKQNLDFVLQILHFLDIKKIVQILIHERDIINLDTEKIRNFFECIFEEKNSLLTFFCNKTFFEYTTSEVFLSPILKREVLKGLKFNQANILLGKVLQKTTNVNLNDKKGFYESKPITQIFKNEKFPLPQQIVIEELKKRWDVFMDRKLEKVKPDIASINVKRKIQSWDEKKLMAYYFNLKDFYLKTFTKVKFSPKSLAIILHEMAINSPMIESRFLLIPEKSSMKMLEWRIDSYIIYFGLESISHNDYWKCMTSYVSKKNKWMLESRLIRKNKLFGTKIIVFYNENKNEFFQENWEIGTYSILDFVFLTKNEYAGILAYGLILSMMNASTIKVEKKVFKSLLMRHFSFLFDKVTTPLEKS